MPFVRTAFQSSWVPSGLLVASAIATAVGCSSESDGTAAGASDPSSQPGGDGTAASGDGEHDPSNHPPTTGTPAPVEYGNPPASGAPSYPKDGFCGEPGIIWAYCEDFDGQGAGGSAPFDAAASGMTFTAHSHGSAHDVACETSGTCAPRVEGGSLFLNAEDGGFGMNVLRIQQPFDFAGREGRIHYKSDMRGHGRMHQNIHVGPLVTNSAPDLRRVAIPDALDKGPAIDIDYIGDGLQPITITTWKDGYEHEEFKGFGPLGNVPVGSLHDIDIYLSRTRVRIAIDGKEIASQGLDDIGFDRGYVYVHQLAYNPVKDGYSGKAVNTFLWDDIAFDGPVVPKNSLTPAGKKDVLFRAYAKAGCTVRGVPAFGPIKQNSLWDTWHVQFDASAPAITAADMSCTTVAGTVAIEQPTIQDIATVSP